MTDYAFGIDLGGTTVKIGLFSAAGELVYKHEIPTRKEDGGKHILPDIAEAVRADMEAYEITPKHLKGIGLDVPGPVLDDTIVNRCVNLGWGRINVVEELTELTGIRNIRVANDANVAALGEMWKGGGRGHDDLVMVTLGTGVGGGIIVRGKILGGSNGAGGEIGHMLVNDSETVLCGCGKKGHLEQYTSATGIARLAREALEKTDRPSALREYDKLSARKVFDQAKAGDELALEIVDQVCRILGHALAVIACVVDPEVIVIGGGVSKAGTILTETTARYFREAAFHACENTEFALAELGNDAGMYGAVKMVL
ncbi:MAG: ROK family glucokinase [Lachnospiraceae bacterium]|nr:ROK family glucokinase [Lachnospiraceae bacterium]